MHRRSISASVSSTFAYFFWLNRKLTSEMSHFKPPCPSPRDLIATTRVLCQCEVLWKLVSTVNYKMNKTYKDEPGVALLSRGCQARGDPPTTILEEA